MLVARWGHLEVVEYLVTAFKGDGGSTGADWIDLKDKDGWTALNLAAWYKHERVVAFLTDQGADTRRRDGPDGEEPGDCEDWWLLFGILTSGIFNETNYDVRRKSVESLITSILSQYLANEIKQGM